MDGSGHLCSIKIESSIQKIRIEIIATPTRMGGWGDGWVDGWMGGRGALIYLTWNQPSTIGHHPPLAN